MTKQSCSNDNHCFALAGLINKVERDGVYYIPSFVPAVKVVLYCQKCGSQKEEKYEEYNAQKAGLERKDV